MENDEKLTLIIVPDETKNRESSYQTKDIKENKEELELIHKTEKNQLKKYGKITNEEQKRISEKLPKHSKQKNPINFCKDFEKYFDQNKFIDFISELYMINVPRGVIEITSIPEIRYFKILDDKEIKLEIKKKIQRLINQKYSLSRIHIEFFEFVFLIYSILFYFVYLISKKYYL